MQPLKKGRAYCCRAGLRGSTAGVRPGWNYIYIYIYIYTYTCISTYADIHMCVLRHFLDCLFKAFQKFFLGTSVQGFEGLGVLGSWSLVLGFGAWVGVFEGVSLKSLELEAFVNPRPSHCAEAAGGHRISCCSSKLRLQ